MRDAATLHAYPFVWTTAVRWGELDAVGHVNHTVVLRWFESCRLELLSTIGLGSPGIAAPLGIILAALHCDYREPVHYPGTVHVGLRVEKVGHTSLRFGHAIFTATDPTPAAAGGAVVVLYDYENRRPTPITARIRESLEPYGIAPGVKTGATRRP
jgi:acyl-CoA thioester hydrolase